MTRVQAEGIATWLRAYIEKYIWRSEAGTDALCILVPRDTYRELMDASIICNKYWTRVTDPDCPLENFVFFFTIATAKDCPRHWLIIYKRDAPL